MTLMAGPIDTRISPTKVNELATTRPIGWFERNLIAAVPWRFPGAFRRVYPGFVQLASFMSMNLDRHVKAHRDLYEHIVNDEEEKALAIKTFYDEYFAVLDLTAEFYLETVRLVFQEYALPRGTLTHRGRRGRSARDPPHAAADGRRRARRHLRDGADAGGARTVLRACGRISSAITCSRAPDIMACSAGANGRTQIYPLVKNAILASN